MNNSFEFDEHYNIVIDPQIATLDVFKAILAKYRDKALAVIEYSYVVYMLHPKSDFIDIRDDEERSRTIIDSLSRNKELIIDEITEKAIEFYIDRHETPKTLYLNSVLNALNKTKEYLDDIDYEERDDKGNFLFNPKEVIIIIKESPKLMSSIKELEDQIKKESELENTLRGSGKKGVYEE